MDGAGAVWVWVASVEGTLTLKTHSQNWYPTFPISSQKPGNDLETTSGLLMTTPTISRMEEMNSYQEDTLYNKD